jgi:hypothetical protein
MRPELCLQVIGILASNSALQKECAQRFFAEAWSANRKLSRNGVRGHRNANSARYNHVSPKRTSGSPLAARNLYDWSLYA